MARPLILVVEDDFLVRINTVDIFEEAGFDVVEARDAANALEVLRESADIQLICADVHMPGELDGIELAMRVREDHPYIKLIVTSGSRMIEDLPPDILFLPKPFMPKVLIELAQKQLRPLREGCPIDAPS